MSESRLADYAEVLAAGIEAALPAWVIHSVETVMSRWRSDGTEAAAAAAAAAAVAAAAAAVAGQDALREVGPAVRHLLSLDIDDQRTTPLALLRGAVRYPTAVLRQAGVPPVERDAFSQRAFPDDIYDLSPSSFADIDPALVDAGISWGAAKAFEHKARHKLGNEKS